MGCNMSTNKYNDTQNFLRELDEELQKLTDDVFVYCCEKLLNRKELLNHSNYRCANLSNVTTLFDFIAIIYGVTKNDSLCCDLFNKFYTFKSFDENINVGFVGKKINTQLIHDFDAHKKEIKKHHVNKSSYKTQKLYILENNKVRWSHKNDVKIFNCDNSKYLEYAEHTCNPHDDQNKNKFQINFERLYKSTKLSTYNLNTFKNLFAKKINSIDCDLDKLEKIVSSDDYLQLEKNNVAQKTLLEKSDFNVEDGIEYKKLQNDRSQLVSRLLESKLNFSSIHSNYSTQEFMTLRTTLDIILNLKQNIMHSYHIICAFIDIDQSECSLDRECVELSPMIKSCING